MSNVLLAQLCQGSLGDPLVNITFGAGSNPGPALSAATTSYQYTAADCPIDGSYTVRSRTDRCFAGWHTLNTDHTGDPGGYFMLVNASQEPGTFYVDTVDLSCSNTTYEFATWVLNMNSPSECNGNPNRPNLTFIIENTDGTVLQSYNSGDIVPQAAPAWQQFGFFFNTPPFVNKVVLKIRNNAPGGCGNDLALDDITFRPCGPKLTIAANGGAGTINLCEGTAEQVSFTSTISPGFDNPFLQWQRSEDEGRTWTNIAGANAATLLQDFSATTPPGSSVYRLTAARIENSTILACRVYSETLKVAINENPPISITATNPVCEGSTLGLSATGGVRYSWQGSGGFTGSGNNVSIPAIQLSQAGRYFVTGFNAEGCQNEAFIDIVIHPSPQASVGGDEYTICEGDTVQLSAGGGATYSWRPSINLSSAAVANPLAYPKDSTLYSVYASNQFGCADSASVMIHVYKRPKADAGPDKEISRGQHTTLSGAVSGTDVSLVWSPAAAIDNVISIQPTVSPATDQEYVLTVTSNVGCGVSADTVRVKVYNGIFVPTAFTPNRDGKNDVWRIFGLSVFPSYEILVFNRYGGVIYRSRNANAGWDGTYNGKLLETGSYPYLIRLESEKKVMKGLVTIIR